MLKTLPEGTVIWDLLDEGERGDGIRRAWMDGMQREGVKVALASVDFAWDDGPKQLTIAWTKYLPSYAFEDEEFSSSHTQLRQVRVSHDLDRSLREAMLAAARQSLVQRIPRFRWKRVRGSVSVMLLDDEWLPAPLDEGLEKVFDPDETPLMQAVEECHDPGMPPPVPIHGTVRPGPKYDQDSIGNLLKQGANVNARNQDGEAALSLAAQRCRPRILEMLLKAGADVNVKNKEGETPLMRAVGGNRPNNVQMLLAAGAEVNSKDERGETALLRAAAGHDAVMVQRLLAAGADVNAADDRGKTVLIWAVDSDSANPEVVRMLLAAHANVNARTKNGQTALSTAMRRASMDSALSERFLKIAELLREAGARE